MTRKEQLISRRNHPPKWTYCTLSAVFTLMWLSHTLPWYGSGVEASVTRLLIAAFMWALLVWPAAAVVTLCYALRIGMTE